MSFDVNGSAITGAGHFDFTCSSGSGSVGFGFGAVLTGTVTSDGSFTIAPPPIAVGGTIPNITISGIVPKVTGGSWEGTYKVSGGPPLCLVATSGSFTATMFSDVSGTYGGSGAAVLFPSGVAKGSAAQLTLGVTLQQGGALYQLGEVAATYSRLALNGSINVDGIPCFSKGTSSQNADSLMEGSQFVAGFDMNDGSRLQLVGEVVLPDASQLNVIGFNVVSGTCAGAYTFGLTPLALKR